MSRAYRDLSTIAAMRCSSCGSEIADPEAAFCSRCGAPVAARDAEATDVLRPEETPGAGTRSPRPEPTVETKAPVGAGATAMAGDMAHALRSSFVSGGWPQATSAAVLGFASVLAMGALLVATWKLAFPDFASGSSPLTVLTYIVIAGLMCLGVPVEQAGSGSSLLPLGALAVIAWVIVWAGRRYVVAAAATSPKQRALEGAKLGAPLAILCFLAAVIFRLRGEDVGADPALALMLGAVWGALFGAVGGLTTEGRVTDLVTGRLPGLSIGSSYVREGLLAGATMLAAAALLSMAGVLAYLIVALVAGGGVDPTVGEAIALLIVLAIFAPNLAAGAAAFSLGAPTVLVASSFGVGIEREVSLLGWGDVDPAWYLYVALLIPLVACLLGGYVARRRAERADKPLEVLGIAAATFAVVLSLIVYVGTLNYSAGALGEGSLLVLRPSAGAVFLLALLWGGAAGYAGWKVADGQEVAAHRESSPGSDGG
jgi:hypothetical protein